MNDILAGMKRRKRKAKIVVITLIAIVILLMGITLMVGDTFYPLDVVVKVIMGDKNISGASFAVGTIRLPRMLAGVLVGFSLGLAGSVFQKMLRNTLASPDIVGISSGTSMAAVFCILILQMSGPIVSLISMAAGLLIALLVYMLSSVGRFSSARFILIGIGLQAIMNALISYMLLRANQYEVSSAMRWLSGSLNRMQMSSIPTLLIVVIVCTIAILLLERYLNILELGDDIAVVLGVRVKIVRILLIVCSVFMIAFATSVAGPIAFVSFLAGPIALRLVGSGQSYAFAAGLVGSILVLCADMVGQFVFATKFPVGVITGVIGAPYLIILLIRINKTRGVS